MNDSNVFKTHKDLDVWKESYQLSLLIYKITLEFPECEKYGIINQMRRAAVSVVSNIAEGAARFGNKEFVHYLYISLGSLSELETQLLLTKDFGYHCDEQVFISIEKVRMLLIGLIKYLKCRNNIDEA